MASQCTHTPLINDYEKAQEKMDAIKSIIPTEITDIDAQVLRSIFSTSPYLTSLILKFPDFMRVLLTQNPDDILNDIMTEIHTEVPLILKIETLKKHLRIYKSKIALLTSFADLTGRWTLFQVTEALSHFAEASTSLIIAHLLKIGMVKGEIECPEHIQKLYPDQASLEKAPAHLEFSQNSGYIALGMGKLGGYELNYSSDIDLIMLYDSEIVKYTGRKSMKDFFVKLTQNFSKIMQERTEDGYVFRTDLRLRPDPSATPLAMSVEAAEIYYQSVGLNWERAAMIKARPVGGDHQAGYNFLTRINDFIWRKHLDYAALEDIHSIKNLIHSHHKHGEISLFGQDVKLGPGGIREIEFYAQIFQLISGGREPSLRIAPTCSALEVLEASGKITPKDHKILLSSYKYLRTLEHRLQMINDDQTHTIPTAENDVLMIAHFLGFETIETFEKFTISHLEKTHKLFNELLKDTRQTEGAAENLLPFPPGDFHPVTIRAIKNAGFGKPKEIYTLIQNWLTGRYRACRTERARNKLHQLIPEILHSFSAYDHPTAGLHRLDVFFSRLPSGVQLFSFLVAQPWLLDLIAKIMNMAPDLSDNLAKRPQLLDTMMDQNYFNMTENNEELKEQLRHDLEEQISFSRDFQDILDISRRWANEHKFQVGVQILKDNISAIQSGINLSIIADLTLEILLTEVQKEFSKKHGRVKNSHFCIIAMGKLGGQELTSTSDLDLIFLYDYTGKEELTNIQSDGDKPLSISLYYNRLSQRLINAITALTPMGTLYEVDMRLRPSGSKGPLAVTVDAFQNYQLEKAWTWEHMALTRARTIAGHPEITNKINTIIKSIIFHPDREKTQLLKDVSNMRHLLHKGFGTGNIWSFKHTKGGLVDIEFIIQYLLLKNAAQQPELIEPNNLKLIKKLTKANHLTKTEGQMLYDACETIQICQMTLRLCMGTVSKNLDRPESLLISLAKRLGCHTPEEIEQLMIKSLDFVRKIYDKIIEVKADEIPKSPTVPPLSKPLL